MTFWPDTRFDGISTDAKIRDPAAYGIAPGPAGYSIADLRCAPTVQRHARGIYTESAVALVLSGIFEHLSDSSACMAVPGSLVFANKRAEFSCRHQGQEGNRRIVVFFSENLLDPLAITLVLTPPSFKAPWPRLSLFPPRAVALFWRF